MRRSNIRKCGVVLMLLLLLGAILSIYVGVRTIIITKIENTVIEDQENYKKYQQYNAEGKLDADGYYVEEAEPAAETKTGTVRVTFSTNSNLDVSYYLDKSFSTPLEQKNCYLNPGDSIYAVVSVKEDSASNMYEFSEFRVYTYNENVEREILSNVKIEEFTNGYEIRIPTDLVNGDIAIVPIGEYQERKITLNDYYTDENGEKKTLTGTWIINDKEYMEDFAWINPVDSYVVSYEFDSDEYFFCSSTPECYYSSNTDGVVIFSEREANDETEAYSVELCRYFSVELVSDRERWVKVNSMEREYDANDPVELEHLQYGNKVEIETDQEWSALYANSEVNVESEETLSGKYKYKYTLSIPEKNGSFRFDPEEYSYDHGTIVFKCFGQIVSAPKQLSKGSKIFYEEAKADEGYWLSGKQSEHYVVVGEEEETKKALEQIHFTQKVSVTVDLPQPESGGTIVYKLDGKEIEKSNVSTYSGATITMSFQPWEGWISPSGEKTYDVSDDTRQTIDKVGNIEVKNIFTEDEDHKPELSLNLEKSVGTNAQFELKASGFSIGTTNYDGGWKITDIFDKDAKSYAITDNTEHVFKEQKIGTDEPIQIIIKNKAIQYGTAVRLKIVLTEKDTNKKTTEIRYIDDPNEVEPFYIYQPGENATAKIWYSAIKISIGIVDVEEFTEPKALNHTTIKVEDTWNTGKNSTLGDGDLVEKEQKVRVSITPDSGYYILGEKVKNGSYSETMTYAEYRSRIDNIVQKHTVGKYFTIKLDRSDKYAKYTYKLAGKVVPEDVDSIEAREGQKLELTYKITDSTYRLVKDQGGIPFIGVGASDTEMSATIQITPEMDGRTLSKADFQIETARR